MASSRTSGAGYDVFLSFRGAGTRKLFSDYLYQKLMTDETLASGGGDNRYIRRGGNTGKAFLTKRVDVASAVPAQLKGKSCAEFYDFCGRDVLTKILGILGEDVYASEQFFLRSDTIKALEKPLAKESGDIWIVGVGEGKATFLRVAFGEFSTHLELLTFLADIQEFPQVNGLKYLLIRLVRKLLPFGDTANYSRGDWMELIREIISTEKVFVILDDVYQREQIKKLFRMPAGVLFGDSVLITVRLLVTIRGNEVLSIKSYIIVGEDMSKGPQEFLLSAAGEMDLDKHLQPGTVKCLPPRGIVKAKIFQGDSADYSGIQNYGFRLSNPIRLSLHKMISIGRRTQHLLPLRTAEEHLLSYRIQQTALVRAKDINLERSGTEYEVVLSSDTGLKITDRLYKYMEEAGICVFRSYKKLHKDEEIDEELLLAIKNSKICIPIFSGSYAWRASHLHELACMVESQRKSNGREILPVFYDVEPLDVMLQSRLYSDAVRYHRKKYPHGVVQKWEEALRMIATIKGWESKDKEDNKLCKSLVRGVLNKIKVKHVKAHSVGMEDQVEDVRRLLDIESGDVLYVGVHGIGGIGKTTLVKVIFDQISVHFEGCSFLSDVRESSKLKGLNYLQEQLCRDVPANNDEIRTIRERFRDKKVLIVLDDVDQMEQIEGVLGSQTVW